MGQCNIAYPGVARPIRASYSDCLGLWPGVWTLDMAPQGPPAIEGTLSLTDGDSTLHLRDARLDSGRTRYSSNGFVTQICGFDARWKWEFGWAAGEYNIRSASGDVWGRSERTPQELAELLFAAWGITNADCSVLAGPDRPHVVWEEGKSVRAYLFDLLNRYGCSVAIDWPNLRPVVVRLGVGQGLPDWPVQSVDFSIDPAEAPRSLRIVCGPNRYEAPLRLEAVVEDADGSVLPYNDPKVSFRPEDGWDETVTNPSDPLPDGSAEERELARRSLYRWFRPTGIADRNRNVSLTVPLYGPVRMWQLRLRQSLVEGYEFETDGAPDPKGWYVVGKWWVDDEGQVPETATTEARVPYRASFDPATQIVKFRRPMVRMNDAGQWVPAELYLVTSFTLFDGDRLVVERQISSAVTAPRVIVVPELFRRVTTVLNGVTLDAPVTNDQELSATLNSLLDVLEAQYQTSVGTVRLYGALVPLQLDGLRRQATYVVHAEHGANTTAALNTESEPGVLRQREMRRLARMEGDA